MKPPWQGLSIFSRTFLLMVAALFVAEGIGLTLLVTRPPVHNEPMQLSDVARHLQSPSMSIDEGLRPPPGERLGPDDRSEPPRKPPPSDRRGGPSEQRREWILRDSPVEPSAPASTDLALSSALQTRLAGRLGVARERARLFVRAQNGIGPRPIGSDDRDDDPQLREGFVAAWQRADGSWRVLESVVEGFPNEFHRQALLLFAAGLAVLLPLAWLFARALSAPIRRFATAAKRLGTDSNAPALPSDGPSEMQAAIDAFNAMQSRLHRLLRERAHMIGAIAHDLRTPLTRLAFRLDDLQSPLKEKVEADIHEMKLMIAAALDFIRDRSLGGERERLDFRLLVESVVDDQSDVGHDVTLQAGEPIAIEGDPVALRRMVVNLVDNALKYGERARLRLRVADEHCQLEIDDDGPGIPEPLQERVFEPFFRAEASRNRDTGGIGLGLASVRAIVLDHGGDVSLRNRKEGGLRVCISLPIPSP